MGRLVAGDHLEFLVYVERQYVRRVYAIFLIEHRDRSGCFRLSAGGQAFRDVENNVLKSSARTHHYVFEVRGTIRMLL